MAELSEIKVSIEEVEESLLETQRLVEEMESKHREEATELAGRLRQVNISLSPPKKIYKVKMVLDTTCDTTTTWCYLRRRRTWTRRWI